MAWFESFRNEHGFVSYKDNRTPVTFDIQLLIVTYLCVIVSIATLIATLGIRGRERWSSTVRAMYAVAIGSIILACLVGHGWQEGTVKIKSHYVYRNSLQFEGHIGIKVALGSVNVTLDGHYRSTSGPGNVYYSESLPWSDFGYESEGYTYFLKRGLPEPILKVMEFMTVDEGGLRWGRSYHTSGYYAMALLWTSFAFWIVSNVLLCSVIVYGAYMVALTGLTMILACVTYHVCQCPLPLVICFGEESLTVSYSWSYWLTLAAGCVTLVLGIILIATDHFAHDGVSEFFHLEKLIDEDNIENDRRESYNTLVMDRRGSVVPLSADRHGSIFLDPCRQPGLLTNKLFQNVLPGGMVLGNKSTGNGSPPSKLNPLYGVETKRTDFLEDIEDDLVRLQMEHVCDDIVVCMSGKKPSLATLKEHRENHVNERLSSSTEQPHSRYKRHGHETRFSHDGIFTISNSDRNNVTSLCESRRDSSNNFHTAHTRERSISETSCESEGTDNLTPSTPRKVLVCVESHSQSSEDLTTKADAPQEYYNQHSSKQARCYENDSGIKSRNNSQSSQMSESPDVIVQIN